MEAFLKKEINHKNKHNENNQCTEDWTTFRNPKDGHLYGYKVFVEDMINYFQAELRCRSMGAEIVSIHSAEENSFVAKLAAPLLEECQNNPLICAERVPHIDKAHELLDHILRGFWIGLHRNQFYPFYNPAVVQVWSDRSECDYGCYEGEVYCDMNIEPWGNCDPSGTNSSHGHGQSEDCTGIYLATSSGIAKWNDLACNQKIGDGWPYVDGKAFHAFPLHSPGNYWQALSICHKHDAQVASIHSNEENKITSALAIGQAGGNISACSWIGLHSAKGGSKERFWDDGSNVDYGKHVEVGKEFLDLYS
uniref:C-type lectin domain-containing protein n=1 Tax=Meloidogyne javanica TaxID=6303 RepID=A0A915MAU2_MELJA